MYQKCIGNGATLVTSTRHNRWSFMKSGSQLLQNASSTMLSLDAYSW